MQRCNDQHAVPFLPFFHLAVPMTSLYWYSSILPSETLSGALKSATNSTTREAPVVPL
jgi:hypothetical protein